VISIDDARSFVLEDLAPLAPVEAPLGEALGCVCADDVRARVAVPGFANSAMDGFAVRAADTSSGAALRVTGAILAGDSPQVALGEGEAVRIMTGAPLPDGADAIVKIEDVALEADGRVVRVPATREGEYVRRPGEDTAVGQLLVGAGDDLGPSQLGVLAGQGLEAVRVHPRPRVGVLSTGNELSEDPEPLPRGKIRDTNRPTLLASLRASGFTAVDLGRVGDDEAEIAERLRQGVLECDAVVTTGGVSVGDVDFVKSVLAELCGARARWMQVAVRPGKPFAFGVAEELGTPIFGLPGNPVSTLVSYELFVRPALRRLAGRRSLERLSVDAVLDVDLARRRDGKVHLVHVSAVLAGDGRLHVVRASREGSHLLSAVAGANAVAWVPDGDGLARGQDVRVMVLDVEALGTVS
jgi:molybdopterin molybdotransferase